jgi:hypothetical protein
MAGGTTYYIVVGNRDAHGGTQPMIVLITAVEATAVAKAAATYHPVIFAVVVSP